MSVSKWLNCCSLVSGMISAKVSQFLLGCSLSKPVRYWRRVSALGPWVKCTRSGARNSANSRRGARGACGNRSCFLLLMLILVGYRRFTDSDKVVLDISFAVFVEECHGQIASSMIVDCTVKRLYWRTRPWRYLSCHPLGR